MQYKLVIFDFDGTLADSFQWFVSVLNQLAEEYRFKRVEPHEHDTLRRSDSRTIMKHLGLSFWKMPRIATRMRLLMKQEIHNITPFSGAQAMLAALVAQGVTVGLATSNVYENVQIVLGEETARLFTYRECGASLFGKARLLKKILRQSSALASEAIYIGDEIRDLEAARAVKMPFGGVAWGYTHPDALKARAPDAMFQEMEQLAKQLV